MNLLVGLGVGVVVLLVLALVIEAWLERRDRRRLPPPGQLVDVGGHRIHVVVWGEDRPGPTVILDAGMVSFSSNWAWVAPVLAASVPVITYDRSGLGWSEMGPGPHDGATNARELTRALDVVGARGPYVLAGHSYGGLTMRAFEALRPGAVKGMVLVDASHPDQWQRFGFSSRVLGRGNRVGGLLARFGLFRLVDREYEHLADGLPSPAHDELLAFSRTPRAFAASSRAAMAWDSVTRPLVNEAGDLGDRPLVVLSVTEQPRKDAELTELQAELPGLSTNSRHVTVEGADHEGLLSRAEHAAVVTEAILDVVEAVRTGHRLARPAAVPVGPGRSAGAATTTASSEPDASARASRALDAPTAAPDGVSDSGGSDGSAGGDGSQQANEAPKPPVKRSRSRARTSPG
jgi:pimeloyl-ACP methyl ester carboxylesterase